MRASVRAIVAYAAQRAPFLAAAGGWLAMLAVVVAGGGTSTGVATLLFWLCVVLAIRRLEQAARPARLLAGVTLGGAAVLLTFELGLFMLPAAITLLISGVVTRGRPSGGPSPPWRDGPSAHGTNGL